MSVLAKPIPHFLCHPALPWLTSDVNQEEAVKKEKTISQLSSEYGVHANQINQWRRRLLEELPDIFSKKRKRKQKDTEELQAELYRQIGQLKVELDWLKRNK